MPKKVKTLFRIQVLKIGKLKRKESKEIFNNKYLLTNCTLVDFYHDSGTPENDKNVSNGS